MNLRIAILIAIALPLAVWGVLSIPQSHKKPALRIGLNNWPGYEFLYLAKEKGFFKQEGVDVEIVQYSNLEDIRFGYERGQIDITASTIIELLMLRERTNKKPRAFMLADFSNGGDVIMAKNSIKSIQDLKGKSIGVEPQSLGSYMLYRALEKAGLKLSDVKILGLDQGKMVDALKENHIQAAITYPPTSFEISKAMKASEIFSSSQIPGEVIDILSADEQLLKSRKEDFAAIMRAWDKALNFTKTNTREAHTIMAQKEGITPKEFSEALEGIKVLQSRDTEKYFHPGGPAEKSLGIAMQLLKSNGQLKEHHPPADLLHR